MSAFLDYREFAEAQRRAADAANLPLVRMRHLEAADSWDRLADELEWIEQPNRSTVQDVFY